MSRAAKIRAAYESMGASPKTLSKSTEGAAISGVNDAPKRTAALAVLIERPSTYVRPAERPRRPRTSVGHSVFEEEKEGVSHILGICIGIYIIISYNIYP